jgi:hypothetical protein
VSTSRNPGYLRDSVRNDPRSAEALHGRYQWRYDVVLPGGIDVRFIRGVQWLENGLAQRRLHPQPRLRSRLPGSGCSDQ